MKKGFIVVMAIIVVVFAYFIYNQNLQTELQYITIDINPSIQLGIDKQAKIVEILALNDEGDILLSDLTLENETLEEGIAKLVSTAVETGYIDEFSAENDILITSYSDDVEEKERNEKRVREKMQSFLEEKNIYARIMASDVTAEIKELADEYDINYGKMLLIERALRLNAELSREELVNSSIREIQLKIKEAVLQRRNKISDKVAELRTFFREEREERITENANRLNDLKQQIINDNDNKLDNVDLEEREQRIRELLEVRKEAIRKEAEEARSINNRSINAIE